MTRSKQIKFALSVYSVYDVHQRMVKDGQLKIAWTLMDIVSHVNNWYNLDISLEEFERILLLR